MEEGTQAFRAELEACREKPFLGVLSDRRGEFVDSILARDDVRVVEVTEASREVLPGAIAAVLGWEVLGPEALELAAAAGVILAGGQGTRLSPDKGWLEVGDVAIAERAYGAIRPLVRELVVAGDPEVAERLDARWVADEVSDAGPLAGITGALSVVPAPLLLVAAWDMPFLSPALGAYMAQLAGAGRVQALGWKGTFDAVAPRTDRGPEPLFAATRRCSSSASTRRRTSAAHRRSRGFTPSANDRQLCAARCHSVTTPPACQR